MEQFDLTIFHLSPISMWLQDFSGVKKIFQRWKDEGVVDFEKFLHEDLNRLNECLATIHTLHVNQSTLDLYEAKDLNEILENFIKFLTPDVTTYQIKFFCALWNHQLRYAIPVVNYTCKGKQIDIQLSANIVTGYEDSWELLLLTTEHISDYQNARRFAESIFIHSPTALWVKDYSEIKKNFDHLKNNQIHDLSVYIETHPEFVKQCFDSIQSKYVNKSFLSLFELDLKNLNQQISKIFPDNILDHFKVQLKSLATVYENPTEFEYETETQYHTYHGQEIYVLEKLNIFPDPTDSWQTIQIAYIDFTERKKLENHLNYVSKYDQLTELHNRTFFMEEVARLQHLKVAPFSCIYMDVNGLKDVNDIQGHYYGDQLLKCFAQILKSVVNHPDYTISRIGGDEFVILMPYANEQQATDLNDQIEAKITEANLNGSKISVATGISSTAQLTNIDQLITLADQNMYRRKRNHYELLNSI